jgi:hypothetical protein
MLQQLSYLPASLATGLFAACLPFSPETLLGSVNRRRTARVKSAASMILYRSNISRVFHRHNFKHSSLTCQCVESRADTSERGGTATE